MPSKTVKKAIFPIGGLGTRFLPATKSIPKEMLPLASKPLIQHVFEEAVEAGIEEFIFVTGRNKYAINNHFDHAFELQTVLHQKNKLNSLARVRDWTPRSGQIAFIPQREPKGLGHAVWCARHFIQDEPFAVLLADEVVLSKEEGVLSRMITAHQDRPDSNMIGVAQVAQEDVSKYGIIDIAKEENALLTIAAMVEKPKPEDAPSSYSITGRYILQPDIFPILEQGKAGIGGEIQLTDALQHLLATQPFYGFPFEDPRYDCGNPIGFLEANIAFALANHEYKEEVETMLKGFIER